MHADTGRYQKGRCHVRSESISGLLKSRRAGLAAGALAGVCYSLLDLLVLSEEYALLFGALALFFLLAATMVAARKLDWYRVASPPRPGT